MEGKKFNLKALPYAYDSLEPFIDKETVTIHHDKHQQTYTDNLNNALSKHPEFFSKTVEEILKNLDAIPEDIRTAVINNGGGVFNHEFYWDGMSGNKGLKPTGSLNDALIKAFGSYENFKNKLKEASLGRFGSGWGWLVLNEKKELEIISTANQDCPISNKYIPLLTVDVWEHAYYLKYQNKRADYLTSFFEIINWDKVQERFDKGMSL